MRTRMMIAALLAASVSTTALAQDREGRRHGGWRANADQGQQAAPEQRVRTDRGAWHAERQQQAQAQVAAPQAQAQADYRGRSAWRGQARVAPVTPSQAPQAVQQRQRWSGWSGNQAQAQDWRNRDRDGDGVPNWRDRDRDGDGIRNRRDFDNNNDGRVDRRWDRNNNGVVDRRFDRNRNGVLDRRWDNGWRNDRRYDWQRYRYANRYLYRLPRYYSPYGWGYGYQRFGIGVYLDSVLFGRNYWLDDPYRYRLPPAEWPYRWVRYYNDALLVDTESGEVVDVIYDIFY